MLNQTDQTQPLCRLCSIEGGDTHRITKLNVQRGGRGHMGEGKAQRELPPVVPGARECDPGPCRRDQVKNLEMGGHCGSSRWGHTEEAEHSRGCRVTPEAEMGAGARGRLESPAAGRGSKDPPRSLGRSSAVPRVIWDF